MKMSSGGKFSREGIVDIRTTRIINRGRLMCELLHEVSYCNHHLEVQVPVGFHTDFASVPRPFWVLVSPFGIHGAAAIVHDYLYVNQGNWKRQEVDALFYEMLGVLGVKWRRPLMWLGVRLGGWIGWNRHKQ